MKKEDEKVFEKWFKEQKQFMSIGQGLTLMRWWYFRRERFGKFIEAIKSGRTMKACFEYAKKEIKK